jgi:hypothetical protein
MFGANRSVKGGVVQAIVMEEFGGEQRPLAEAAQAHRLIEARATAGPALLVP